MDITPFVGRLVDGGSHDVALSVANAGDVWNLSANLLLYKPNIKYMYKDG